MPTTHERDVEWNDYDRGEIAFRRKELSNAAGGAQLGCSLYELDPGSRSWPLHYHRANEEALYVLAGEGTLRTGEAELSLEAGSFVSLPADERGAHQLVNDGEEPLRYLAMSTMREPDLTVYPERGTFGVYAGSAPGGREERSLHGYYPLDAAVDYWTGEPVAAEGGVDEDGEDGTDGEADERPGGS